MNMLNISFSIEMHHFKIINIKFSISNEFLPPECKQCMENRITFSLQLKCGFTRFQYNNDDNNNWNPLSDNNIVFRDFSASTCHVCNFFDKTAFFFLTVYTSIEIILDDL